jgi:hypothetical protein
MTVIPHQPQILVFHLPELRKQLPSAILFREELESRTFYAPTFRRDETGEQTSNAGMAFLQFATYGR